MLKIVLFLLLQVCFNQAELEVKICGNLRYGHTMGAAVYDNVDHIWFLGGYQLPLPLVILDTVVRYDVNTYESEIVRRFPYGIYYGAAEIDGNGEIFHFGGTTRERRNEIFNFNETNARPRIVNYFADGVNAMSAVTVGKDTIFLFGGNADPDFDPQAIYLYNTTANTLRVVARLPISLHSLAPVYDGKKVYIFGGMENGVKRFDIYKFDPAEFTIETLDLTTSPNFPISTAQYVGNNQSILIGYNSSGSAYFARFHHSNETLEDLHVNSTILTKLDNPSSAYVPKTNKIYFHGDDRMISSYSTSVYCLELSAGNSDITCPSEGLHFLPHPTNCSLYYVCNDGESFQEECADGLFFDPTMGKCNLASEVDCQVQQVCPPNGLSYIPVIGTCSKYILCIDGEGTEQECAEGTEFSPEEQQCVLDAAYECPYTKTDF